jgi:hypothetical protein
MADLSPAELLAATAADIRAVADAAGTVARPARSGLARVIGEGCRVIAVS